jgi:hypothetical protein
VQPHVVKGISNKWSSCGVWVVESGVGEGGMSGYVNKQEMKRAQSLAESSYPWYGPLPPVPNDGMWAVVLAEGLDILWALQKGKGCLGWMGPDTAGDVKKLALK